MPSHSPVNEPGNSHAALSPANAERLSGALRACRDMEGTLNEQLTAYAAAGREFFPAYSAAVDRLVARISRERRRRKRAAAGRSDAAFRSARRDRPVDRPQIDAGPGAGRRDVLSRPLVSLLQAECPRRDPGPDRITGTGRPGCCDHAGAAAIHREIQIRIRCTFPVLTDLDNGYALSLNLAIWLGDEIQQLLSYQDMSKFHGNEAGCCRFRRRSSSAVTAW